MPNLKNTFAIIKPNFDVDNIAVTPTIYEELNQDYNNFKEHQLISMYEFSQDWGSWENHPKGDETIVLISGAVTLVLKEDEGHQEVTLEKPGDFFIMPKNTWHTAKTKEPSQVLFITPGEGTQHQ